MHNIILLKDIDMGASVYVAYIKIILFQVPAHIILSNLAEVRLSTDNEYILVIFFDKKNVLVPCGPVPLEYLKDFTSSV